MADSPDKDQKTEAPTAKRRRESAEKGETLQSRELGTALVVGAGVVWVLTGARAMVTACTSVMRDGLTLADPLGVTPFAQFTRLAQTLLAPLAVFGALAIAGAVAGPLLLAPHFSIRAVAPKASRLDPVAGLVRMVGSHALVELGKALVKAALIFGIGLAVIGASLPGLIALGATDPASASAQTGHAVSGLLIALGIVLVGIAAIDLPIQLMRHLAKLRMSKQEVKEESRESEGSPETKAARGRMARQAAKRALVPAMATATVVIVNPAHFAVALRYVAGRDAVPVVAAKGRDVVAQAIRELAADKGVPMLSYPHLTRAIYFTTATGMPIKTDLYAAVATVLAFILRLDSGAIAPPVVEIPYAMHFDEEGRPSSQ